MTQAIVEVASAGSAVGRWKRGRPRLRPFGQVPAFEENELMLFEFSANVLAYSGAGRRADAAVRGTVSKAMADTMAPLR
jgi:hypothetical protein